MSINRIKRVKNENFTTISNEILKNKQISLKAKGLHVTIMSLSDNWDFSISGMTKILNEGKSAIYSAVNELIEAGYVKREKVYENGKIKEWQYVFVECLSDSELLTENLEVENLKQGNLHKEKRPQLNTKEIKNEVNKERRGEKERLPQNEKEKNSQANVEPYLNQTSSDWDIEASAAVKLYLEEFPTMTLDGWQLQRFTETTDGIDLDVWRKVLDIWKTNGHKVGNIAGMVSRYKKEFDYANKSNEPFADIIRGKEKKPDWQIETENCRLCDMSGLISFKDGSTKCLHSEEKNAERFKQLATT